MDFDHQVLSRNAFGLVDPMMVDFLPEGIEAPPLVPQILSASARIMPRLLDFQIIPAAQQTALLDCLYQAHKYNEQPVVGLFVQSAASAGEFARHWNVMQLPAPHPERKFWLRLHDPRVLHQILRIVTSEQRRKLFGPCDALTYWVGGEWVNAMESAITIPSGKFTATGSTLPYAGATKWDWARIERIGMVNRALFGAGVYKPEDLTSSGSIAESLFERAFRHHGLVDTDDIVEFAIRGLTMRDRFDEHPEVVRAIQPRSATDGESGLADRFALIDELVWSELSQTSTTQ
jgi:hypothetical protein